MKTVITFGTFDLFHIGHLNILSRARSFGDRLIVGISSDKLNMDKKGFYPLFSFSERSSILNALKVVDQTFMEESLELKRFYITQYGANTLVMGNDWLGHFDSLKDVCDVKYLDRTPDISSSLLRERLKYPI